MFSFFLVFYDQNQGLTGFRKKSLMIIRSFIATKSRKALILVVKHQKIREHIEGCVNRNRMHNYGRLPYRTHQRMKVQDDVDDIDKLDGHLCLVYGCIVVCLGVIGAVLCIRMLWTKDHSLLGSVFFVGIPWKFAGLLALHTKTGRRELRENLNLSERGAVRLTLVSSLLSLGSLLIIAFNAA